MSNKIPDQETRIQLVIVAIYSKKVPSIRQVALLYDIPRLILYNWFQGGQSHQTAAQHLQRLLPEEELSIVKVIYYTSVSTSKFDLRTTAVGCWSL